MTDLVKRVKEFCALPADDLSEARLIPVMRDLVKEVERLEADYRKQLDANVKLSEEVLALRAKAEKLREALEGLLNLCYECESPAVYLVDEDFYCSNCVLKEDALGSNIYIPNTKAIAALAQGEKGKECE